MHTIDINICDNKILVQVLLLKGKLTLTVFPVPLGPRMSVSGVKNSMT